jgi:pyridoxal phosphate enzyme (YggS family)
VSAPDVIAANLAAVRARIAAACERAGRDPAAVKLVAVTKTWPAAVVRAAYAAGLRDFGENYAQEFVDKRAELADLADVRWHFIGHLQTNKARFVAPIASVVHAVDTAKLAVELGRRAADAGRTVEALVQVNVSGELSKSGCEPAAVAAVLDAIEASPALRLRGLMTVPPAGDDAEAAAPVFRALVALRDARGGVARLPELSMGMTHDLEVAVACGATMVRVGSALFVAR